MNFRSLQVGPFHVDVPSRLSGATRSSYVVKVKLLEVLMANCLKAKCVPNMFGVSDLIKRGKKNPSSTAPSLPPFTHKSARCCDVDGHLEKSSLIVEERAVSPALCSTMRISATIFTSNN